MARRGAGHSQERGVGAVGGHHRGECAGHEHQDQGHPCPEPDPLLADLTGPCRSPLPSGRSSVAVLRWVGAPDGAEAAEQDQRGGHDDQAQAQPVAVEPGGRHPQDRHHVLDEVDVGAVQAGLPRVAHLVGVAPGLHHGGPAVVAHLDDAVHGEHTGLRGVEHDHVAHADVVDRDLADDDHRSLGDVGLHGARRDAHEGPGATQRAHRHPRARQHRHDHRQPTGPPRCGRWRAAPADHRADLLGGGPVRGRGCIDAGRRPGVLPGRRPDVVRSIRTQHESVIARRCLPIPSGISGWSRPAGYRRTRSR